MLVALLAFAAPTATPLLPQFGPAVQLSNAVERPGQLELIDLDGDSVLDLRLSSTPGGAAGAATIHWLRGDGTGGFADLGTIASTSSSGFQSTASGDVDGDGDADVVASFDTGGTDQRIVFFANRGDGTFDPPVDVAVVPGFTPSLLLFDWDGDGDDDVVFGSQTLFPATAGSFVLVESLGGGAFAAPADVDSLGTPAREFAAGDLDGDGDPDLVANPESTSPSWYRNDGSVPFAGPFPLPGVLLTGPRLVVDLDGDGTLDVLLNSSARIEWSPNLGGGVFGPVQTIATASGQISAVRAVDLDRDGDVDVMSLQGLNGGVWFENLGGATAFAPQQELPGLAPCNFRDIVEGDVDGDGIPDIVTACGTGRLDSVRNVSTGNGLVLEPTQEFTTIASTTAGLAAADMDGDGTIDLVGTAVATPVVTPKVYASFGSPDGLQEIETILQPSGSYFGIQTGDLDSDGDMDAVAATLPDLDLVLLENPGDGSLVVAQELAGSQHWAFRVADVDGDGDDDIALAEFNGGGTILWFEQTPTGLAPVAPLTTLSVGGLSVVFGGSFRFADLDGDGIPDLVAATIEPSIPANTGSIVFLRGLGGATFGPRVELRPRTLAQSFTGIEVADLDGDGRLDPIGVGQLEAPSLTWYRNLGGGTFEAEAVIEPDGPDLGDLLVFDADLDGAPDLHAAENFSGAIEELRQWENRGDGTFESATVAAVLPERFRRLEQGDFDSDGDVDIAASTDGPGGVVYLPNLALAPIGEVECTSLPNSTGSVATTTAFGSTSVATNRVQLRSADLPVLSAGYYLASLTPDNVVGAGGSLGVLCLGGSVGRYVGPGQILSSGLDGAFALNIDLTAVPQPTGFVSVAAGETWRFQAWYRDAVGGAAVSNFSNGLAIQFD
ncbi:MAG: VCBS repeat-containing protein [Planctomycetota bacterium]